MLDTITIEPQTLENYPQHAKVARSAHASFPNNRAYADDNTSDRSIVALLRTGWLAIKMGYMAKISDREVLERVAPFEPTLIQSWRPRSTEPLPQPWKDPVSGLTLPNPWAEPQDVEAQNFVSIVAPQLAAYFIKTKTLRDTYKYVGELRATEERNKKLAGIEYSAQTHRSSPYVRGDDTAINCFIQTHDPLTCEIFQLERLPVRCFWSPLFLATGPNRTTLSYAATQDPQIGAVLIAATKVEQELISAQQAVNRRQIAEAEQRGRELAR